MEIEQHFWTINGSKVKSKENFLKNLEINENGNTIYQNLWGAAKEILRRKFMVINAYAKKKEGSHTPRKNPPNFISQGTTKAEENKHTVSIKKGILEQK